MNRAFYSKRSGFYPDRIAGRITATSPIIDRDPVADNDQQFDQGKTRRLE